MAARGVGKVAATLRELPEQLRLLGRGFSLLLSVMPARAAILLSASTIGGLTPVLHIWLMKLVVDRLAAGIQAGGSQPAEVAHTVGLAVLASLPLVYASGMQWATDPLRAWVEDRAMAAVDRRLMAAGERLVDLYRIERPAFGDELRLLQEVRDVLPRLFLAMQGTFANLIQVGALLFLLGRLHPLVPLVLAVATVPHFAAERRLQRRLYESQERLSRTAGEMAYCARVATDPGAAKEVRLFGLGDFFLQRFDERAALVLASARHLRLANLRTTTAWAAGHAVAVAGGFAYVAVQASAGSLTIGDLVLYLNAVRQAEQRTQFIMGRFPVLYDAVLRLRGLFRFLDGAGPAISLPAPGAGLPVPTRLQIGVEWRDVSFHYPVGDAAGGGTAPAAASPNGRSHRTEPSSAIDTPPPNLVLDGVSAILPAGQVTALVGANGAGKSTLVKLLTRMYDPTAGQLLLDGQPLPAYDLHSLRRRTAVVYQDFARFSFT
ncbi:MAG TPA: ABC transporter ATP-binding protein, partial [Chloroflexota bacterium]|nr:ABC transporter ATP-binding protein [Chloroflexota bacterium]